MIFFREGSNNFTSTVSAKTINIDIANQHENVESENARLSLLSWIYMCLLPSLMSNSSEGVHKLDFKHFSEIYKHRRCAPK